MTDGQHGRALQLVVKNAHHPSLAFFVERGGGLVKENPAGPVNEKPGERKALLLP